MTAVRTGGMIYMATAGDNVTGRLFIRSILCSPDGTNAGTFVFKNGAGVVFLQVEVPTDRSVPVPVCTWINGIEMDAIPTTGICTIFVD